MIRLATLNLHNQFLPPPLHFCIIKYLAHFNLEVGHTHSKRVYPALDDLEALLTRNLERPYTFNFSISQQQSAPTARVQKAIEYLCKQTVMIVISKWIRVSFCVSNGNQAIENAFRK